MARDCLDAHRVIGIEDVSQSLYDAVAASRAPPESVAFNHEIDPDVEQESWHAADAIVCDVSGEFSLQGVRYHEHVRPMSEIAPADWSALLNHADVIGFFERAEPASMGLSDCTLHPTITAGKRTCKLAINDPYETPGLACLISLTRRALNDRQVMTSETMSDEMETRLVTSLPSMEEIRTGCWSWEQD